MTKYDTISIAVAEDSAFHCQILSLYVSAYNNMRIIIEAANGHELINELSKSKELPEICILDLHMPVMDGIATAEIVKKQYPNLTILGYTSSINISEIECFSKLVQNVFYKDDPRALFDEIRQIQSPSILGPSCK